MNTQSIYCPYNYDPKYPNNPDYAYSRPDHHNILITLIYIS